LGSLGFVAALGLIASLVIEDQAGDQGMKWPFTVAFLALWLSLQIIVALELARFLVLFLVFIGRKTGLFNHQT